MNSTNETNMLPDVQDEIIEIGVASVETKGPGVPTNEIVGTRPISGISAE